MTAAPPPAPRPNGPRAAAQLLYTNVDRVADGRAVSGWQTMEVSAGLDEAGATLMRGLIEPSLNPLRSQWPNPPHSRHNLLRSRPQQHRRTKCLGNNKQPNHLTTN